MSRWEKVRLGEVATIQSGYAFKSEQFIKNEVPIIRIGNLNENIIALDYNVCYPYDFWKQYDAFRIEKGDILIAMSGATVGKVGRYSHAEPALLNQRVGKLCNNDKFIFPDYSYWFVKSGLFYNQIQQLSLGCAQPNISARQIEDMQLPLPPYEIQKQIAKTLDKTAELLIMRKQQLTELDNLIKSTFNKMFGDPIMNSMGFQLAKLGDIGELNSGGTPTRSNHKYFMGDIDWYSAGELNQRYLNESKEKLTIEAITKSAAKVFNKGSMLIGMYDTAAFKLGILLKNSSSNQACANVDVNKDLVNIEWLYDCTQIMRPFFLNSRRGVRQKNLNLRMIRNFEIPLPPLELQNQFAAIVAKIEEQKALVQKAIDETQYLFDSLMSEYFD